MKLTNALHAADGHGIGARLRIADRDDGRDKIQFVWDVVTGYAHAERHVTRNGRVKITIIAGATLAPSNDWRPDRWRSLGRANR